MYPLTDSIHTLDFTGRVFSQLAHFHTPSSSGILRRSITLPSKGHLPNEVLPQDWQRYLGIEPRKKGKKRRMHNAEWITQKPESRVQFKRRLKMVAEVIFRDVKVTLNTADALLIAHYARKVHGK